MKCVKFRAWDNVKNKMYFVGEEDDLVFSFDSTGITATAITEPEYEFKTLHHLKYMQYVGLKDKNNNEIYEGDIVNVNQYGGTPKYETVTFYTHAGFGGVYPFTDSGHHWSAKNCDIVGNIYQNAELIK